MYMSPHDKEIVHKLIAKLKREMNEKQEQETQKQNRNSMQQEITITLFTFL